MAADPQTTDAGNLLSIYDAAKLGVERLRQTNWANQFDHIKIDIIDGRPGPWIHLWAPFNQECNGRDPIVMDGVNAHERCLVLYTGPLPDSAEYRAEVAKFAKTTTTRPPAIDAAAQQGPTGYLGQFTSGQRSVMSWPGSDTDRAYNEGADAARAGMERENRIMRAALTRLRDCDWTITPMDRMDAVRDIARAALEGREDRPHD